MGPSPKWAFTRSYRIKFLTLNDTTFTLDSLLFVILVEVETPVDVNPRRLVQHSLLSTHDIMELEPFPHPDPKETRLLSFARCFPLKGP